MCLVPDTNVVFKWYVTEQERNLRQARLVRDDFLRDNVDLLAPDILPYEFANILRVAADGDRLPYEEAVRSYADFEAIQIPLVDTATMIYEALRLALAHRVSVFDATFLLVGLRGNCTVVTEDDRLVRVGQFVGCRMIRLTDYQGT